MALGADAARIFRMVMSQGAWQLAIGLVLGAGGAALLLGVVAAAALANILFKVNALDPTIYFAVAGLLTLVAAAIVFCSRAPRNASQSDGRIADGVGSAGRSNLRVICFQLSVAIKMESDRDERLRENAE